MNLSVNLFPFILYEIAHENSKKFARSSFSILFIYFYTCLDILILKNLFQVSYIDKKFKNSFGVIFDDVDCWIICGI